jgi:hypothetical protein
VSGQDRAPPCQRKRPRTGRARPATTGPRRRLGDGVASGGEGRCRSRTAAREQRLIVTFDKDFGELAFRQGLAAPSGIVLFRLSGSSPEIDNARASSALESRDDWAGKLAVVEDDRIRMRPLP